MAEQAWELFDQSNQTAELLFGVPQHTLGQRLHVVDVAYETERMRTATKNIFGKNRHKDCVRHSH
jgi:stage III sporulation protein SpoIIIAA